MAASIGTDSDLPGMENGGGEAGGKREGESPRLESVAGGSRVRSTQRVAFGGVLPLFAFTIRFSAVAVG